MAHFAEIKKGLVQRVIVLHNDLETDGVKFCKELFGGDWIQTSYNGKIRKQFAGIGYTYDKINDVFIAPQPYGSWVLNNNFDWQAPKPKPEGVYFWDETLKDWVKNDF
jgi:hypothetical protein